MGRMITKIDKNAVTMQREDFNLFISETEKAVSLTLHCFDGGKSKNVRYPLEVHLFLLSVIEAAIDFSGGAMTRAGGCCEDECKPFGGCDFQFGSIAVCNGGELIVCSA